MNAVLIAAVLAAIKDRLLKALKDRPTDVLTPLANLVAAFLTAVLDAVDVAALEQDIQGRLLLLIQQGKGPSNSSDVDVA